MRCAGSRPHGRPWQLPRGSEGDPVRRCGGRPAVEAAGRTSRALKEVSALFISEFLGRKARPVPGAWGHRRAQAPCLSGIWDALVFPSSADTRFNQQPFHPKEGCLVTYVTIAPSPGYQGN